MFSLSNSVVVDVVSRAGWALFAADGWDKSTSGGVVAFGVKSSLAGSAEDGFCSRGELADGVALALVVLCDAEADGASPLAA